MQPGPRNHLLDVAGLRVGHASDARLKSGVTAVVPDAPAVASVAVHGGAPGSRETELLAPERSVERVDAVVLSGGSAFGLIAGDGAQVWLWEQGRGHPVAGHRVPIVPAAIVFDLTGGGDHARPDSLRYRELGYAAASAATPDATEIGSVGAGTGCTTATLKGGLGSASARLGSGATVAALAVVNAVGTVTFGDSPHFRAAPFEIGEEFGGLGLPAKLPADAQQVVTKRGAAVAGANTAIAVIATDAVLSKAEARRLAVTAHDGLALAIWPAHTAADGDTVFALSTGRIDLPDDLLPRLELSAAAAAVVARAVARAVHAATPAADDPVPTWSGRWGSAR